MVVISQLAKVIFVINWHKTGTGGHFGELIQCIITMRQQKP